MENIENEVRAIDDGEYVETVLETERFPATVWPKKAKGVPPVSPDKDFKFRKNDVFNFNR